MALTNGSGYTLPTTTTCYKSGTNGTSSFAYGSDKIEIDSFGVKYYYNDSLVYTSDEATIDVYPMIINYYGTGTAGNTQPQRDTELTVTTTSITWTFKSGYPDAATPDCVVNLGLENQTSSADYYNMRFCFQVDGASKLTSIKESGSSVQSLSLGPVADGDTFKIQFAAEGGNGNITFPQIPESKNIKNSAFMS